MDVNYPFTNQIIADGFYFEVGQDWECPILGFFIVRAKRKVRSVSDFSDKELTEFILLLCKTRKGMNEVLGIKDVYLFQNEDTKHDFHLWIFPRHTWMEKFGRKIQSVRPIMNYAKENMFVETNIHEIKQAVEKMRKYMNQKEK